MPTNKRNKSQLYKFWARSAITDAKYSNTALSGTHVLVLNYLNKNTFEVMTVMVFVLC
jgi:hypothetical protein